MFAFYFIFQEFKILVNMSTEITAFIWDMSTRQPGICKGIALRALAFCVQFMCMTFKWGKVCASQHIGN